MPSASYTWKKLHQHNCTSNCRGAGENALPGKDGFWGGRMHGTDGCCNCGCCNCGCCNCGCCNCGCCSCGCCNCGCWSCGCCSCGCCSCVCCSCGCCSFGEIGAPDANASGHETGQSLSSELNAWFILIHKLSTWSSHSDLQCVDAAVPALIFRCFVQTSIYGFHESTVRYWLLAPFKQLSGSLHGGKHRTTCLPHALPLLLRAAVAQVPLQLPDSRTFPCRIADGKLSSRFELNSEHQNLWLVADVMRDTRRFRHLHKLAPGGSRSLHAEDYGLAPQTLTTSDHA